MLFHTHVLLGIVLFLLVKDFFSGGSEVMFFLLVLLGSILPDIDERRSKINRWSGIIGSIVAFFAKHRGFFHSLLCYVLLFFVVYYYFSLYYAVALFIGYLAHMVGDGFTKMGVQPFYPFFEFKIRGPLKVGGMAEGAVMVLLVLLIIKEFL